MKSHWPVAPVVQLPLTLSAPVTSKYTFTPGTGAAAVATVAVTVWLEPTGLVAATGETVRSCGIGAASEIGNVS